MASTKARLAFWLVAAVHTGTFAQGPVKPGKWELTGAFKGIPFISSAERVHTACLTDAVLGSFPEKAFIEASPQPGDDGAKQTPPKCEYSQLHRAGSQASWVITCEGPTLSGVGSATTATPEQVDLLEKVELKTPFFSRSIEHIVRARRLGDCS